MNQLLFITFLIFISFYFCHTTAGDSSLQRDSNTVVGKPQLGLTVGISVGLFVLFLGMAIFIYKPKTKRPVRTTYNAIDQPMLV